MLAELQARHRSLLVAPLVGKRAAEPSEAQREIAGLVERVGRARLWAVRGGLSSLVDKVVRHLEQQPQVELRLGHACTRLEPPATATGPMRVHLADGSILEASHVVSGVPAPRLAAAVAGDGPLAKLLGGIPMASMVVVNAVYEQSVLPFPGFGYLVPTTEPDNNVLGVVFDSAVFPELNPPDQPNMTRVTVMSGGYAFDRLYGGLAPAEQHARAEQLSLDALRTQLGVTARPQLTNVVFWRDTMPQYRVGHAGLCAAIEQQLAAAPWHGRLHVTGNSYYGAGVNDTVHHAVAVANRLL